MTTYHTCCPIQCLLRAWFCAQRKNCSIRSKIKGIIGSSIGVMGMRYTVWEEPGSSSWRQAWVSMSYLHPLPAFCIRLTVFLSYHCLVLHHSSNNCHISHLPPCCAASGHRIGPDPKPEWAEIEKEEKSVRSIPGNPGAEEVTLCNGRTTWEQIALAPAVSEPVLRTEHIQ